MKDGYRSMCKECFWSRERKRANERYRNDKEFRDRAIERATQNSAKKLKESRKKNLCNECGKQVIKRRVTAKLCCECLEKKKNKPKKTKMPEEVFREKRKALWNSWYSRNKEKVQAYRKEYTSSPEFRLQSVLRRRHRHMLEKGMTTTMNIMGITFKDYEDGFINRSPIMWEEWKTGNNDLVIDHIIPVCLYDIYNNDDIIKCWNPRNLRIITRHENAVKSGKLYMDLVEQEEITDLLPASHFSTEEIGQINRGR